MNGLRNVPLINGVEPSWANLKVNIAGFPETAITAVTYEDDQVVENIMGAGQVAVARGYGNITPKASVTLLRSAVEAIRASSDTGRLQDIAPFDIVVCFVPMNGTTLITHKLRNCQFTKDSLDIKQGDTKNETTFDLVPSHIEWR
ncbi:MAG TPA: hypothetical protein PKN21_10990 [Bacteroidales bacterium]|nr:hypothetical protein [Bacteroidales bacterium]